MTSELARIEVADAAGVFTARQLGRAVAAQLALESRDQVRVATALSEVSRSAVMAGLRAVLPAHPRCGLRLRRSDHRPQRPDRDPRGLMPGGMGTI
jgi:anti-sigma regulatory factor (Ser/Thr protein kinase)